MPRPKSENKKQAILNAAIRVFAAHTLQAPTAAISRSAKVAEGTLFTYFPTKDDLLNALYRDIKLQVADALMSGFARKKDLRSKLHHIWNAYVNWGVSKPAHCRVLDQLRVSGKLTGESTAVGSAAFMEIETMARDAIASGIIRDLPLNFIAAVMEALAGTTVAFMAATPSRAARFRKSGFEIFWNGVANQSLNHD